VGEIRNESKNYLKELNRKLQLKVLGLREEDVEVH
jgi:hypothetical protein